MTHAGLRAQKTPPPRERPGLPPEPGPQSSGRTVRRSSGKAPLLVVASLAGAAADGVDAAALSFFTARALEARRKEEEEKEKEKRMKQSWLELRSLLESMSSASSSSSKKRKKKAPKPSSSARVGVQLRRCGQGFRSRSAWPGARVSIPVSVLSFWWLLLHLLC